MTRLLRRFAARTSGATAIEYALIASLISLAIIAGASQIAPALNAKFNTIRNNLS